MLSAQGSRPRGQSREWVGDDLIVLPARARSRRKSVQRGNEVGVIPTRAVIAGAHRLILDVRNDVRLTSDEVIPLSHPDGEGVLLAANLSVILSEAKDPALDFRLLRSQKTNHHRHKGHRGLN